MNELRQNLFLNKSHLQNKLSTADSMAYDVQSHSLHIVWARQTWNVGGCCAAQSQEIFEAGATHL